MDNYESFESFKKAVKNSKPRKVYHDGSITVNGRKYYSPELMPYIGQYVCVFLDLDDADAICFTLFDRKFICNAQNPELWEAMFVNDRQ
jgi:hypothetical protein